MARRWTAVAVAVSGLLLTLIAALALPAISTGGTRGLAVTGY
jgi:hypothetical protein